MMRLKHPAFVSFLGAFCGCLSWLLFLSVRRKVERPPEVTAYSAPTGTRHIYSIWHDSAFLATYGGRRRYPSVALTSQHRDGLFTKRVVGFMGIKAVRGSTNRRGGPALLEILKMTETHEVIVTPDGPRGPRREMSRGIVYLASRSGLAIAPTTFACNNCWDIPTGWTTHAIPKPFSTLYLFIGPPLHVPPGLDNEQIESYRQELQRRMDAAQERADQWARGQRETTSSGVRQAA